MRNRFFRIVIAAAAATLLAFLLFGALNILVTPGDGISTASVVPDVQARELALPRRAISIPFGISSPATLTQDGSQLLVTGHGVCWTEGQMFDLRVRIAQSTTNAFADGRSVDICAGGARQIWTAQPAVASQATFEAGPARACAEAIEFAKHGVADEYRWCKDIELNVSD